MELKPVNVTERSVEELKEVWENKIPMIGITALLTHENARIEEIISSLIFRKYGEKFFPECKKIPVGFSNNEEVKISVGNKGKDAFWKLLQMGYLCFGMSGGPLDDHEEENSNQCSATLLAKYLGVRNNKELRRILSYALYTDQNGDRLLSNTKLTEDEQRIRDVCQPLLPAKLIKDMWDVAIERNWGNARINNVINSMMNILEIEIENQKIFHETTASLTRDKVKVIHINNDSVALIVEHKSSQAQRAVRNVAKKWIRGKKIALVVSANPISKMFVCLKSHNEKDNLIGFTSILRSKVAKKRGLSLRKEEFGCYGTVEGIPLYFHPKQGHLFNGSHSQKTKDGLFKTDLHTNDFIEAINYGLGKEFHSDHKETCLSGACAGEICPLFGLGLTQCQKVKKAG